jgi:hypothetical protein
MSDVEVKRENHTEISNMFVILQNVKRNCISSQTNVTVYGKVSIICETFFPKGVGHPNIHNQINRNRCVTLKQGVLMNNEYKREIKKNMLRQKQTVKIDTGYFYRGINIQEQVPIYCTHDNRQGLTCLQILQIDYKPLSLTPFHSLYPLSLTPSHSFLSTVSLLLILSTHCLTLLLILSTHCLTPPHSLYPLSLTPSNSL